MQGCLIWKIVDIHIPNLLVCIYVHFRVDKMEKNSLKMSYCSTMKCLDNECVNFSLSINVFECLMGKTKLSKRKNYSNYMYVK